MALNRKIVHVDLKQKKIDIIPIPDEWRRKFLGGRGIGAYLLYKYSSPKCKPLSPGNAVVISAGLLGGTLVAPFGSIFILSKSPLTNLISHAQLKGLFAAEMRWAGFDHVVITGRGKKPVYLYMHNGEVEIRDATQTWGKTLAKTQRQIRKEMRDQEFQMLGIGPAGENLVSFATIFTDQNNSSGGSGMGAVFGSKNIKAVVCRGTMDLEIKQPKEVLKCNPKNVGKVFDTRTKNNSRTDKSGLNMTIRDVATSKLDESGFDWSEQNDILSKELGMEPLTVAGIIHWVFNLIEKDKFSEKTTNFPRLRRQNSNDVLKMIQDIAYRKEYGDILARGPLIAAGLIRSWSIKHFVPVKCLLKLYSEAPHEENFAKDETCEMILNCLGINPDTPDTNDDSYLCKKKLSGLIEQIRFYTGLIFKDEELEKIANRCYTLERLYNIREAVPCKSDFQSSCSFDVPSGLEMTGERWDTIDMKTFKRKVSEYYRERKWNKKDLFKAGTFKRLEIADLWSPTKP
jgi:aldehyde:ferredoxin oxidoreductase